MQVKAKHVKHARRAPSCRSAAAGLTTESWVLQGAGGAGGAGGARRPPTVHLAQNDVSSWTVVAGVELLPPAVLLEHSVAASYPVGAPPQHLGVVAHGSRESVRIMSVTTFLVIYSRLRTFSECLLSYDTVVAYNLIFPYLTLFHVAMSGNKRHFYLR